MSKKKIKLNLGCGEDYLDGWINADLYAKKVDLRFDAEKAPFPIKTGTIDEVRCFQLLEHLRYPEITMAEIFRILKPGGIATLIVPHYTSAGSYNFRHHSQFSTTAIYDFLEGHEKQNELMANEPGAFRLISAVRKLRGIHIDVGCWNEKYFFDFLPIWDSIIWKVRK